MKFQYRIQKGSPISPILRSLNPIPRSDTLTLRSIVIFFSLLWLGLPRSPFPVGLSIKIRKGLLSSYILVSCPVNFETLKMSNFLLNNNKFRAI